MPSTAHIGSKEMPSPPITCAGCDSTWRGDTAAHCSGCHETFASVGSFDRHRLNYTCRPPASRGLIIGTRGMWTRDDAPAHPVAA